MLLRWVPTALMKADAMTKKLEDKGLFDNLAPTVLHIPAVSENKMPDSEQAAAFEGLMLECVSSTPSSSAQPCPASVQLP